MAKTFTFRTEANGPVVLTVEAETSAEALGIANERLVWGKLDNFYAWTDEMTPRDYTAMYGVWD